MNWKCIFGDMNVRAKYKCNSCTGYLVYRARLQTSYRLYTLIVTNIHDVIYPLNRRWVTLVNTLVLDTVLLPGLSGEVTPAARVSTTYNDSLFTWRNTLKHILVYCMMLIEMYIFKSCNNLFILHKKNPMQLYTISWVLIHVHVVSLFN